MGACGCSDFYADRAFRLRDGAVLTYDLYHGCRECFEGIGVTISVFTGKSPFVRDLKCEQLTANEYGGGDDCGVYLPIVEVEDLVFAAGALEAEGGVGPNGEDYPSIAAWLEDRGLELLQAAIRRHRERKRPEVAV